MILLEDSECPDQTAPMRRLTWTFAVRLCPKTHFCMARSKLYCVDISQVSLKIANEENYLDIFLAAAATPCTH